MGFEDVIACRGNSFVYSFNGVEKLPRDILQHNADNMYLYDAPGLRGRRWILDRISHILDDDEKLLIVCFQKQGLFVLTDKNIFGLAERPQGLWHVRYEVEYMLKYNELQGIADKGSDHSGLIAGAALGGMDGALLSAASANQTKMTISDGFAEYQVVADRKTIGLIMKTINERRNKSLQH